MASKWAISEGFNPEVAPPAKVGDKVRLTKTYAKGGAIGLFVVTWAGFSCGEWRYDLRVIGHAAAVRSVLGEATHQYAWWFEKAA